MRKSKREIVRLIDELRDTPPMEIDVSSDVVTITDDMTDTNGTLVEEIDTPAEGERHPTDSDAVTVWSVHMD